MDIKSLVANAPAFTRVILHVSTGPCEAFGVADQGDVILLCEDIRGIKTGRFVTALVLARNDCSPWLATKQPL